MEEHVNQLSSKFPAAHDTRQKILVTGATGYIGGQLVPELIGRGYAVRVMVRSQNQVDKSRWPGAEIVQADVLSYSGLSEALDGIDFAYYFIHSMYSGSNTFIDTDNQAAQNFSKVAGEKNLKRIIYLGSLGDSKAALSAHLKSRFMVADILRKGKTPVTFLKAAVIIGSGSASYQIIKYLMQNCPVFLIPRWANTNCQPIAIRDVLRYLIGCLENDATSGQTYDIGGSTVLNYRMMLKYQAVLIDRNPLFIGSVFFPLNLYARITSFFTPVKYTLIKSLMESCAHDVVCRNKEIQKIIPFELLTYEEALASAYDTSNDVMSIESQHEGRSEYGSVHAHSRMLTPPTSSNWPLSDVNHYILHKPEKSTIIKFDSLAARKDYSYRILQRLGVGVEEYKILNIHKIGVNAPAKYVFEELLNWSGESTCWPNNIAKVTKVHDKLEHIDIHLFGWTKFPSWLRWLTGTNITPLFNMDVIRFQKIPDETSPDNARFLLYKCSGGYPIGVFAMYVRSSIIELHEEEASQLFIMTGFNFFGKEKWSKMKLVNWIWEMIHNRVTANVLNRLKRLSEWRFNKMSAG
ncbi:MAG: hypothetical protein DRI69_07710 [Bacteroidetes bacterium]|nr:MAG: hypothetical protein DRI69_07710 [Bacteroidota bacterium]